MNINSYYGGNPFVAHALLGGEHASNNNNTNNTFTTGNGFSAHYTSSNGNSNSTNNSSNNRTFDQQHLTNGSKLYDTALPHLGLQQLAAPITSGLNVSVCTDVRRSSLPSTGSSARSTSDLQSPAYDSQVESARVGQPDLQDAASYESRLNGLGATTMPRWTQMSSSESLSPTLHQLQQNHSFISGRIDDIQMNRSTYNSAHHVSHSPVAGSCGGSVPFYPWMGVVGMYKSLLCVF